jgi:SAM-dependent methyltransferase
MTLHVLPSKRAISASRRELVEMGASALDSAVVALGRRLRLIGGVKLGDVVKSWDLLHTVKFLNANISKADPVLDIGCYASEITSTLHKIGYTNLTGADLNPNLVKMPYQGQIRYEITDFMDTKFSDATFSAITSISVIEHGFDPPRLLKEMSRLLKPGGYFVASFDYWPEKIDTSNTKFFEMDWKIFSKEEVRDFVDLAAAYALTPVGTLKFDGVERPIECGGHQYTFGWLVLRKNPL